MKRGEYIPRCMWRYLVTEDVGNSFPLPRTQRSLFLNVVPGMRGGITYCRKWCELDSRHRIIIAKYTFSFLSENNCVMYNYQFKTVSEWINAYYEQCFDTFSVRGNQFFLALFINIILYYMTIIYEVNPFLSFRMSTDSIQFQLFYSTSWYFRYDRNT
jgi:hypothetical protein